MFWLRLAACTLFVPLVFAAQEPTKVNEPEFNRIPVILNGDGTLTALERQQVTAEFKTKAFGIGGAKSSASFKGPKSPARLRSDQKIQFVVRLETQGDDPATFINLDRLTPTKESREIVIVKVGALGHGGKSTAGAAALNVDCVKYGEHSIQFAPSQQLARGEYVITIRGSREGFLFGVD